jgi:hypothetical protein
MSYEYIFIAITLVLFGAVIRKGGASSQVRVPDGWHTGGRRPDNYEMGIDSRVKHEGKPCARIKFVGSDTKSFGTLAQTFKANDYRGKRLRLSAWIKTRKAEAACLWMRVDGPNGQILGFDNMENRPITGSKDWKKHDLILDVPKAARHIAFGALVGGEGQAWISGFRFETVNYDVPVTNMLPFGRKDDKPVYPKQPVNLDFAD